MTPKQFERMAKCDHRKTCGRLVTLKASSYADPYHWCLCGECPYYTTENAKLRELIADVHESLCADKAGMFHKLILASMEDDMRELGVDVS